MRPYVIRQGDYITKLAHQRGFDADAIWNDPKNQSLRERRTERFGDRLRAVVRRRVPSNANILRVRILQQRG